MVLLYLGLTFLWLEFTSEEPVYGGFDSADLTTEDQKRFKAAIKRDLKRLNQASFSTKDGNFQMREFRRVEGTNVFVFQHSTHVTCSSAQYDAFTACCKVNKKARTSEHCTNGHHYALEPFYRDNPSLQKLYQSVIDGKVEATQAEKRFATEHERKLVEHDHLDYFDTGSDLFDVCGVTFDENTWTRRLCGCLKLVAPNLKESIRYTAEDGQRFKHKQRAHSELPVELAACYPFQGAPDITIKKKVISQLRSYEEDRDSMDSDIVENAHAMPGQSSAFPQK